MWWPPAKKLYLGEVISLPEKKSDKKKDGSSADGETSTEPPAEAEPEVGNRQMFAFFYQNVRKSISKQGKHGHEMVREARRMWNAIEDKSELLAQYLADHDRRKSQRMKVSTHRPVRNAKRSDNTRARRSVNQSRQAKTDKASTFDVEAYMDSHKRAIMQAKRYQEALVHYYSDFYLTVFPRTRSMAKRKQESTNLEAISNENQDSAKEYPIDPQEDTEITESENATEPESDSSLEEQRLPSPSAVSGGDSYNDEGVEPDHPDFWRDFH
jgi:hypothetical protein